MREILQLIAIATLSGVKPKAYHIGSDECTMLYLVTIFSISVIVKVLQYKINSLIVLFLGLSPMII
jgi:hypothetical protein